MYMTGFWADKQKKKKNKMKKKEEKKHFKNKCKQINK